MQNERMSAERMRRVQSRSTRPRGDQGFASWLHLEDREVVQRHVELLDKRDEFRFCCRARNQTSWPQVYNAGDQKKAFVEVVGFKGLGFCEVFRVQSGRFRGLPVWGFGFKGCRV
jgi:hypothetical protein